MDLKPPIKIHGVWQFKNTTDTLCGTSHHQQASTKHLTTGTLTTRTKDLYHFWTHRHHTRSLPPETQRVSSSGNQRVPLLRKQRVSEESRTDFSFIPNASDLQTNNGHISKWDPARESELTRILMSKSIRYCHQDISYADPDKGIHVQIHNGLQFNLTDSNITAQCLTHGNNTSTVSHNDCHVIGFSTGLGPKNRNIDVHFHGADVTTRAIPDTKFNELHDRIKSDTHFWN
jgi:hypothetical protein